MDPLIKNDEAPPPSLPQRAAGDKGPSEVSVVPVTRCLAPGPKGPALHQICRVLCIIAGMGRTNIELDDQLVAAAMDLTGARTKREVVHIALRRLVEKGSLYRSLRDLRGKLAWEGDVDAWRRARTERR